MFSGIFHIVVRTIEEWGPRKKYSKEAGYRDDLVEYLRGTLKRRAGNYVVQRESGRHLADIGVVNSTKVGIELKLNFRKQRQLDTLIGQIGRFLSDYSHVIIVLCGYVDEEKLDSLRHRLRKIENPMPFALQPQRIKIISKGETKGARQEERFTPSLMDIILGPSRK